MTRTVYTSIRRRVARLWQGVGCSRKRFSTQQEVDHGSAATDRKIMARSDTFYEEQAIKRHYFYVMDLRGQLFVENIIRNVATSMKDVKFLDFMYRNLQFNTTEQHKEAPLLTYCGKEINFVTPIDSLSAFVYKDLLPPSSSGTAYRLVYGGSLVQQFDPSKLAFCEETGRMYHEIINHKHLSLKGEPVYGLLNVNITTHYFSDKLVFGGSEEGTDGKHDDGSIRLRWEHSGRDLFNIRLL